MKELLTVTEYKTNIWFDGGVVGHPSAHTYFMSYWHKTVRDVNFWCAKLYTMKIFTYGIMIIILVF